MFELEKVESVPSLPEEWDYDESIDRMKTLYRRFLAEMVLELFQAWRILHLSPSEAAKVRYTKEEGHTWRAYCEALSLNQKTVYNWFVKAGLPYRAEVRGGRPRQPEKNISRDLKEQFDGFGVWVNRLNGHKKQIKDTESIVLAHTLEQDIQEIADVLAFSEDGTMMMVYHGPQSRLFIKRSKAIGYQTWVRK
jgi:hypothetical protein